MTQSLKIIAIYLIIYSFISCSKDEEKIDLIGVWKVSNIINMDCSTLDDNINLSFFDGCATLNEELIVCHEMRIFDKTIEYVWQEKNPISQEVSQNIDTIFYQYSSSNSTLLFCFDESYQDCEEMLIKIELDNKTLVFNYTDGGFEDDCISKITYTKQ